MATNLKKTFSGGTFISTKSVISEAISRMLSYLDACLKVVEERTQNTLMWMERKERAICNKECNQIDKIHKFYTREPTNLFQKSLQLASAKHALLRPLHDAPN